jgi:hypothetical protein
VTLSGQIPTAEDAQRRAHRALRAWVHWLVAKYELIDDWPECWHRHDGVVLELLALHAWHTAALDVKAAPNDLFLWHDALWRMRDRVIRPLAQRCGAMGHVELDVDAQARQAEKLARMAADAAEVWGL